MEYGVRCVSYSQVLYAVEDGVCTVTMNRPDKMNAFTGTMGNELYEAFQAARADDAVRVIVLTGAGSTFCAGVDLQALADPKEGERIATTPFLSAFPKENFACPKPTICALNGAAIGVGVTMALSFDIRVVAEDAKLAVPFVKLGILPGLGSTYLLERLVGRGRTLDLLLSGRSFKGAEAQAMGLAEYAVPQDKVLDTAMAYARDLAERKPSILSSIKGAVNHGGDATLEEALAHEKQMMAGLRAKASAS
jgi:enoyl-CoA hydratase/carnithine racemase